MNYPSQTLNLAGRFHSFVQLITTLSLPIVINMAAIYNNENDDDDISNACKQRREGIQSNYVFGITYELISIFEGLMFIVFWRPLQHEFLCLNFLINGGKESLRKSLKK